MGRYSSEPTEHVHGPDCNHTQLNKEEIFEIPSKGTVIIKFESDNCPHCKALDNSINASQDPKVPIMRVNVDKHPMNAAFAKEVNVKSLPTLVLLKDSKEISRHIGSIGSEQFYLFATQ